MWATKTCHTNGEAKGVARFVKQHEGKVPFDEFCRKWLEKGYTCVFEWCTPGKQRIVKYESNMLILTGIRYPASPGRGGVRRKEVTIDLLGTL